MFGEIASTYAPDIIDGVDLSHTLLGAGVTYYFMPINVFVGGSIGPSIMSIEASGFEGSRSDSDVGFGMRFEAGKEWWVSENWGLGLSGELQYSYVKFNEVPVNSVYFGIMFSATYN